MTYDSNVCEAVQEHHPVHQRVLLQLEPEQDQGVDHEDGQVVDQEHRQVQPRLLKVAVDPGQTLVSGILYYRIKLTKVRLSHIDVSY